jgi:hypothetical protein
MSTSVHQRSYDLLCRALRRILHDAVQAGPGAAGGIGTIECQAVATLYLLLLDHPIDRQGRCRSCRRPGAVFGSRWRRCRVHIKANLCLHQLDEVLMLSLLSHELGLATASQSATGAAPGPAPASDPDDTDVLPAIEPDVSVPSQTPVVPPTPTAPAGRPELDHDGIGEHSPNDPGPAVAPGNPVPGSCRSVLFTGGVTWPR